MRIIASILILFLSLLPAPTASAATWPNKTSEVCVEVRTDKYWGINNAIDRWNSVGAGQPKFHRIADCPLEESVLVKALYLPLWEYGGLTTNTVDFNGDLVSSIVLLNNYSGHGLTKTRLYHWRRYASLHELGHVLGLPHNKVKGSVMCYCTNYYTNNGTLSRYDRDSLKKLY